MLGTGDRATPSSSRLGADGSEPVGCVSCALCAVGELRVTCVCVTCLTWGRCRVQRAFSISYEFREAPQGA
eukprot:2342999-Prymnesium_polylepis.1